MENIDKHEEKFAENHEKDHEETSCGPCRHGHDGQLRQRSGLREMGTRPAAEPYRRHHGHPR